MISGGRMTRGKEKARIGLRVSFTYAVLLLILFMLLAGLAAAGPAITCRENGGCWVDPFDDSDGVETSENLTIEKGGIGLEEELLTWDVEYTADVEPDEDQWRRIDNSSRDFASVDNGLLTLDTSTDNAHWWYRRQWNARNSVGATFEARLKVDFSYYGIKFILYDGTHYSGIIFFPGRIQVFNSSIEYRMDTTDAFHVYRLTIKDDDFMAYADGELIIDGTGEHYMEINHSQCTWGDFDMNPGYVGRSQWDYVRYSTLGAYPPSYREKHAAGELTSTKISLPRDMTWNSLAIDKNEVNLKNVISVAVLDGMTYQPILGYDDVRGTEIDLSSIDCTLHPSIRLKAVFTGDGLSTPTLNEWKVTWLSDDSIALDTDSAEGGENQWGIAMPFAAMGIILLSVSFAAGSELGKWRLVPFVSPLYTRLKRKEVLDLLTRERIFEHVKNNPGEHYNSIKKKLALNNGALAYHLRTLEEQNYIKSMRDGMYKRFYPVDMKVARINGFGTASMQGRIMRIITDHPGIAQKEVALVLGASQQVTSYHMGRLVQEGLVRMEKKGKNTSYFALEEFR